MKDTKVVVVFTGKDLNIVRTEGESGYWYARTDRLNDAEHLMAVRNRRETWVVKDLEHGTAFLIAKITGCFKNPDCGDRSVITFDEYVKIHSPDAWKMLIDGQRYPTAYSEAQEALLRIGVTPEQLEWKKSHPSPPSVPNTVVPSLVEEKTEKFSPNETIEKAKKDTSSTTGIDSSAITISIKIRQSVNNKIAASHSNMRELSLCTRNNKPTLFRRTDSKRWTVVRSLSP